jgi:hypothetical protein
MRLTSIIEQYRAVTTQFMVQSAIENMISLIEQKMKAIALSANARGERMIADASIDHPLISRTRSKSGQAHDSLRINSDTKRIDTTTQTMAR